MVSLSLVISAANQGQESLPCCNVGSLSWETIPHELLQCQSNPWATALHELLQHGSLFHSLHSFKNRLFWSGSPTGSQALPGNFLQHGFFSTSLVQHGAPTRSHPPLRDPSALMCGSSVGCRWISPCPWFSVGCRGMDSSPWPAPWAPRESTTVCEAPLSTPSPLTGVSAEIPVMYFHFDLLCPQLPLCNNFFFFLNKLSQRHCHHF